LPVASVFFEVTEDDRDRLRLHASVSAETWTHDHTVDTHFFTESSRLMPHTNDLPWHSFSPVAIRNSNSRTRLIAGNSDEAMMARSGWTQCSHELWIPCRSRNCSRPLVSREPEFIEDFTDVSRDVPNLCPHMNPNVSGHLHIQVPLDISEEAMTVQHEWTPPSTEPWIPSGLYDYSSHTIDRGPTEDSIIQRIASTDHPSRSVSSRLTMDLQFTTLLSILKTPTLCNHEVLPLNDALALSPRYSSDSDSSTNCQYSLSRRGWHEEESSVSSSFTNVSSNDETSATACASSLSSNSDLQESDERPTAMVPDYFPPLPPTHSSAALSTALTVGEGVSRPTDIHGTQPDP
jgi:hypothetical protein